jgi:hypothetical protein
MMQRGARFLMGVCLFVAAALLLLLASGEPQDWRPLLSGALHALDGALIMLIAVGGLYGHKGIIRREEALHERVIQIEERAIHIERLAIQIEGRAARLEKIEEELLRAVTDEVAARRRSHHHN